MDIRNYTGERLPIAILDPGDDSALVDTGTSGFDTSDLYQFDHLPSVNLPDPPSFTVIGETGGSRPTDIGIATCTQSGTTVTVNTTLPDGLFSGNTITITGAGVAGYDANYTILTTPTPTTFTCTSLATSPPTGLANSTGGTASAYIGIATCTESGTTVTVTTNGPSGVSVGQVLPIAECGVPSYDGKYTVNSIVNPTTFTCTSTATSPPTGLANSTGGTLNNPVNTGETTLDVEWAHAIAPDANIVLIEMTNGLPPGGADVANAVQTAAKIGASVVSMSFGYGEFSGQTGSSTSAFDDGLFTAPNVAYVSSTGDNGANGQNFPPPMGVGGSGYPAYSPNVLAVGATDLNLNPDNSYKNETGWSNPATIGGNNGGGAGGISVYEGPPVTTQPAYQQGTVTKVTQSTTYRTIPDVSFVGGKPTPVLTYDSLGVNGPIFNTWGTSVSAPCWAGLIAIADQGLALKGKPALDTHSTLQTDLYDSPLSDFHDITQGNNGYQAGPGYDLVTGIGSPVANLLIPDLAGTSIDYTVPTAGSPHQLVLRKDGANVELLDNGVVVATQPVSTISDVNITDPNSSNDSLTVDYAFDGIFAAQVDFDHTVSSGYDTVTVNAPNGPSNTISVNENPDVTGAGSIILDGATQTINFQTASEVDVNAGSGGDTITLNGQGGKSGLSKVNVMGGAGNDTLIVDSSNGLFATPTNNSAGIFFNGGGGLNQLILQQTSGVAQTSDVYSPGANPGEGTDVITGPSGTQTVEFQNLSPVYDSVPAPVLTITPSIPASVLNASNAINYTEGRDTTAGNPLDPLWGVVTVDTSEPLNFTNKDTLVINAGPGSDEINLNNPNDPAGSTPGSFLSGITVNGDDPTASDKLIVNGIAGTVDDFEIQPTGVGAGTVGNDTDPAFVPVAFTGIESLVIVGQAADGDSLQVGDTANDDTVTYTPGATVDAGSITGYSNSTAAPNTSFAYVPITFSGITGYVKPISSIGAQLGEDELIIDGSTAGSDFEFLGDGGAPFPGFSSVVVDGHAPIFYSPTTLATFGVVLKALGGNNSFGFTAATTENTASLAVPIFVEGDGPGDLLFFTANSAASTTVYYGAGAGITSTGANSVTTVDVATFNVTANGGSLLVNGVGADDNFAYTPVSAATDDGTVTDMTPTLGVPEPVLNFEGVGAAGTFTIDPLGGSNSVTVDVPATVASILASGGPTPVVQVSTSIGLTQALTLVPADTQTLVIAGGLGSDTLTVNSTAGAFPIPITYNGGSGGGNSLELKDTVNTATSDTYSPGPAVGAGSSAIVIGGVTQKVNFTNVSPVFDFVAGPLTVNGSSANNVINYQEGDTPALVPSPTWGQVSVDASEAINFINKTGLTINGQGGDDTITVNNPNTPTGLAGGTITVNGGPGNSTLVVNANDALFTSAGISSTTVTAIPAAIPVQIAYATIANVHIINSMDALTGIAAPTVNAVAGVPLNNVLVASFQFADQPPYELSNPSDFAAAINWGDGTTTAGTIVQLAPVAGMVTFQVYGTHTYLAQTFPVNPFNIDVSVLDLGSTRTFTVSKAPLITGTIVANAGATTAVSSPVAVASAPITATGAPTNQVEGITATDVVATFVDPNPGASPANYPVGQAPPSITINWGDGTTNNNTTTNTTPPISVTQTGTQPNGVVFSVSAPHIYAEAGNYTVTVTIVRYTSIGGVETPGSEAIAVSNEIVADAPLSPVATQPIVASDEATTYPTPEFGPAPSNNPGQLFSGPVALFTDANTLAPTSPPSAVSQEYKATIDWGDNTPQSAGTVTYDPTATPPDYVVSGTHTYATSGVNGGVGHYPITVYISDALQVGSATSIPPSTLTITNVANVTDNPVNVQGFLNPKSDSGLSTGTPDVTNVTQPDFYGTVLATLPTGAAVPEGYAHVSLTAMDLSTGVVTSIGTVQAGSDGGWNIKSTVALPNGTYEIAATAVDQFGQTTTTAPDVITPRLLIDTTGPVIDGMYFNRLNGQVDYIIKDPVNPDGSAPSGVWVNTLLDSSNYLLTTVHGNKSYPGKWIVTDVTETRDPTITYAYDVAVTFNNGAPIKGGYYLFTIRDSIDGNSSVQDLAENHLDGEFFGSFPSGNGINGSDFVAELEAVHGKIFAPQTIIGTAFPGNGGDGGPAVAPIHSGIFVTAVPRGGSPIFSTSTSPSNGGDPPAKAHNKDKGKIVVNTKLTTKVSLGESKKHPLGPLVHKK